MKLSIFIYFFLAISLQAQFNASFECSKAKLVIEKLVCSDKELANEDINLLNSYRKAKKILPKSEAKKLLHSQRKWLKSRKEICHIPKRYKPKGNEKVIGCLIGIYRDRNRELNRIISLRDREKNREKSKEYSISKYEGYYSIFDTRTLPNGEDEYLESFIKIDKKRDNNYRVSFLIYQKNGNFCRVNNIIMKRVDKKLIYRENKCRFIVKKSKKELILEDKNSNCVTLFKCNEEIKIDGFKFSFF